ncbi:hypothetical protein Tco_0164259 [Tanacetum coccineum]
MDEEATHEEDEVSELYRDVNVNMEGRDTEMIDAPRTIVQTTQVIEDTHVIITPVNPEGQHQSSSVSSGLVSNMLNPSPDTGIESLFNLNTESTSLVDVPVTTFAEPPLLTTTTLPPPPTPLITQLQQTPVPTPATVPSSSLQDLPNFGSLFEFDHRLKTLENNFLEFNQTNQFVVSVSLIPGIVDAYLANKMHEAVRTVDQVKEQVKAQVSKILPKIEKTINEQLEAEVLTHSSNESKTSHAVAANLSKLELKKILINKMESNKSIHRSDEQKNLYKALVDAYKSDKLILDTYGDTVSFKRRRDDEDKDEEPSAGSNRGSKRRRAGKELESTSAPKEKTSKTSGKSYEGSKSQHKTASKSAQTEEPMHTTKDLKEPAHQELLKINLMKKPLSSLIGFRDQQNFLLLIVIGTRLCLMLMDLRSNIQADERIMQESGGALRSPDTYSFPVHTIHLRVLFSICHDVADEDTQWGLYWRCHGARRSDLESSCMTVSEALCLVETTLSDHDGGCRLVS